MCLLMQAEVLCNFTHVLVHASMQPALQQAFLKEVRALVTVLEAIGNTCLECSQDLLAIAKSYIMDTQVAGTVRRIETLGKEQYTEFVTEG